MNLKYAAHLHDIGKIGIPDMLLNKPARLTPEEYSVIKEHTVIGAEILNEYYSDPSCCRSCPFTP